ncbi:MAG: DinB family protein [Lewinellaceae bacterium]|nr:DinB family protein [Lewinellaceae bacterium]
MFNHLPLTRQLAANGQAFSALLRGKTTEEYTWRPAPGKWTLLEIVCHLHDEECEDFRARVRHTLQSPTERMLPIDPVGWVLERDYASQSYADKVETFLRERERSVHYLEGLKHPDWSRVHQHPTLGPMSAQLFLVNWLAHDQLHLRQIIRYQYQYYQAGHQLPLDYAGDW